MIRDTSSRYSANPTLHIAAATGASRPDCDGQALTSVAATTDRDCVLTTHSSHEPLTPPRTESRCLASSRLAGTPYVSSSRTSAAGTASTAATSGCPAP